MGQSTSTQQTCPSEIPQKMANSEGDRAKVPPSIWQEKTVTAF